MKRTKDFFIPLILFVSLGLLITQCKPDSPEQIKIDQKHERIMMVHDEVMPKMKDIYKLKKALKQIGDQPSAISLIKELDVADEAMMAWMHQYKKPSSKDVNYDEYLSNEQIRIVEVKEKMLKAIVNAQNYLK